MRVQLLLPTCLLLGALPLASCGVEQAGPAVETATGDDAQAESTPAPEEQTARRTGGARIVFETTVIDFGTVWDVDEMKGRFPFTNEGGKALNITEVKPSCGCTTTELSRTRFEPGEGDVLELVWKPKGHGPQAKTITVHSTTEGPGIDVLTIKAEIKPFVTFSEPYLRMGDLPFGEQHTKRVHLTCADPNFELLEIKSGSLYVDVLDVGRQADGRHAIDVVVTHNAPWGQMNGSIQGTVRGTVPGEDAPRDHQLQVSVHANLFGDLRVQPTMLAVGHVRPKGSIDRRVRLTNATGEPFQVLSAEVRNGTPADMQVRAEPVSDARGTGYDLILSGAAGDYMGLIRGIVAVTTDIPGEQERTLPIYGVVRE